MGIVVARGTAELGALRHRFEQGQLFFEAVAEHAHFLAQAGGGGGLAVGLGQHGDLLPLFGTGVEGVDHRLQLRDVDFRQAVLEHEGEGGVVDVLRGQPEMHELLVNIQSADSIKLLLDEVFNGFDIVVGDTLDVLDALCVGFRKFGVEAAQPWKQGRIKALELGKGKFAKGNEILNLHADTILHQCIFREVGGESFGFAAVAAIDGRDGGQEI